MEDFRKYLEFQRELSELKLRLIAKYQREVGGDSRFGQLEIVENILERASYPLHVNEIIEIAKSEYDIILNRDSLSSAIAKKIKAGSKFIKTSPNTFWIDGDQSLMK